MSALIRREEGIALASAMLTLMVVTIVTGVVAATAIQASGTSNQTRSSARALAAADAGVQAATFRLSAIGAASTSCFTSQDAGAPTGGLCPGQTDSLGNGESYTYYVGPVLSQTGSCAGLWVTGPSSQPVYQRCIVSIGTANGVSRRVQQRIVAYQPASSGGGGGGGGQYGGNGQFPFAGIFSFGNVNVTGSFNLTGWLGSNGNVSLPSNASVSWGPFYYGTLTGCGTLCAPSKLPFPLFQVPPNPPLVQWFNDQWYASSQASAATTDAQINWPSGVTWNAAQRTVKANGNVGSQSNPVVIPSGHYNFCELDFGGDTWLSIPRGAQVIIDIDSPYRTGGTPATTCTGNTGNINVSAPNGNLHFVNPGNDPTALAINVHGDPTWAKSSTVTLNNVPSGSQLWGTIYAPNSDFVTNTINIGGSIIARSFTAGSVNMAGTVTAPPSTVTPYYAAGWKECPATPSGSDPNSGC